MLGGKKPTTLMLGKNACKISNLIKLTEPKGEFPEKQICEVLFKSCAEPRQNGGNKSHTLSMELGKSKNRKACILHSYSTLKYLLSFDYAWESDCQSQESDLNN